MIPPWLGIFTRLSVPSKQKDAVTRYFTESEGRHHHDIAQGEFQKGSLNGRRTSLVAQASQLVLTTIAACPGFYCEPEGVCFHSVNGVMVNVSTIAVRSFVPPRQSQNTAMKGCPSVHPVSLTNLEQGFHDSDVHAFRCVCCYPARRRST